MIEQSDYVMSTIFNLSQSLGGTVYGFQLMARFEICTNLLVYFQDKSSNLQQTILDVYKILNNVRVNDNHFTFEEIQEQIIKHSLKV